MPERKRPLSKEQAPDPAKSYERAKPEAESGQGRLDAPPAAESHKPDRANHAPNAQNPERNVSTQQSAGIGTPKDGKSAKKK